MSKIHSASTRARSIKSFEDPEAVGNALRTVRQCTGTTLEYLSVKTRIPYKRLIEIEQGISPTPDEVLLIKSILNKRKPKK